MIRKNKLVVVAALSVFVTSAANAQTSGTWIGIGGSTWSLASNWAGGTIPDLGGTVTLNDFTGQTGGHTLTADARSLSEIRWDTAYSMSIGTGPITISGGNLNLNSIRSLGNSPISTFVANSVSAKITGTGTLTKIGNGQANISGTTNDFVGNVNINAGLLWNNSGSDAVYGNAANQINLNGGVMGVATTALTSTRVINVNTGGGSTRLFAALTLGTSNQLRGSGALVKDGASLLTISNANANFTGDFRNDTGSVTLSGAGTIGAGGIVELSGSAVNLTSSTTAVSNRLSGRNIVARGGDITMQGHTSATVLESLGSYTTEQGQGFITNTTTATTGGSTDMRLASFIRNNRGTAFIRGTAMGGASGLGVANIYVTASPSGQVGSGGSPTSSFKASIIPYIWGNTSAANSGSSFLSWDSTTQRLIPLNVTTGYNTNINAAAVDDNVSLNATTETVAAPSTVNSLRMASTVAQTVSGSQITVTSGAILSTGTGGVTIANAITAGSAEMNIFASNSAITFNGVLSGTNGLTRQGSTGVTINNAGNDYSGTTTFNGGTTTVAGGTVGVGSPSVLGQSGDIVMNHSGGSVDLWTSGNLTISAGRNVVARLGGGGRLSIGTAGLNVVPGAESLVVNSNVNLIQTNNTYYNNFLTLAGGDIQSEAVTINGVVSGGGGLRGQFGTYAILNNANTYTGGTIIGSSGFANGTGANQGTTGETWEVGNNNAFGPGQVYIQNFQSGTSNVPAPGTIVAGGGARTLGNDIIAISGYARFAGSNALTLNGKFELNGSAQGATSVEVGANSPVTINGIVSGGGLVKGGAGTLTLTGNNIYSGRTVIRSGVLSVSNIGNAGTAGNIGQTPGTVTNAGVAANSATYLLLGGSQASDTGTLRYTGSGETTDRLFSVNGYGGGIDASGSGPLVFGNTGSITFNAAFGSLTGATVVAGTGVINVGNINSENIPVGTVISNALFAAGTTVTESGSNFIRLSNVPSAAGTSQTVVFTSLPSDFKRTLRLTGTNTGLNTIKSVIGEAATVTTNVVKSGTGSWNLTGANTYTGGTSITGGKLFVNNLTGSATGTGAVTLANGSTLGGNGIISGAVTVAASGGIISPGNSAGKLTVGSLSLSDAASTKIEIDGAGIPANRGVLGGFDAVDATTAVAYNGTLDITISSAVGAGTFDLFNFTSATGDFDNILISGVYGSGSLTQTLGTGFAGTIGLASFTFTNVDGVLNLSLSAVPEPLTAGGVLLLSARLLGRRSRQTI